jgi:hypothetical protein
VRCIPCRLHLTAPCCCFCVCDCSLHSPSQTDTIFISSPDVGALHSLRISHDGSGLGPAWHLARIEVTNTSSGEATVFPYNAWLDEKHGASQLLWPDR